ncbi:DUF6507 family protein [Zafaria sp. Z1313]|uniref:DUF6507 family protein n=1 Tax=unclassified Zafaria TaxID=2828765 RepID=UPI002E76F7DD|nr:DUF6507 family protein [Zafaria sp. J156]MEE1621852.1 DUF6507 family protein [Zafaria sp. J156]
MSLTYWSVDVAGANGVITATETEAGEFEDLVTGLRTSIEDAVGASQSSLISGALQDVHDAYLGKVATLAHWRSLNVVAESRKIVQAWVDGDDIMAADARREIASVPSSAEDAT